MKYLTAALALALSVVLAPAAVSAQSGVTGDWEITLTTPQGATTVNLTLAQDGEKVTGKLDSPMGSVPIAGTNTAGTMALMAHVDLQGNAIDLGLNGKAESDAMSGVVKIGDFGEFPFTGKRAAAKPAAAASTVPSGPPPTDANGKWNIVLTLGGAGTFPLSATFKQDGDKVTGVLSSVGGEVPVSGTMVGKTLKLDFKAETPQGPLPITMTGELGATGFTGKASIAGLGETDWTATRVP
jgi:hypothetical protein